MYQIIPPMHLEEEKCSSFGFAYGDAVPSEHVVVSMDQPPNLMLVDSTDSSGTSVREESRSPSGSSAGKINWALSYSSDGESQKSFEHRPLIRVNSDPSLQESMLMLDPVRRMVFEEPRRRSKSSCSHSNEEYVNGDENIVDAELGKEYKLSVSPMRTVSSPLRSILAFSPTRLLCALFLISCYTTFFLPYPEVRPEAQTMNNLRPGIPTSSLQVKSGSVPTIAKTSQTMFQARAAPELELKFRPGLERYYEQEAFTEHPWTKYANMGALGIVVLFALVEYLKRGDIALSSKR